MSATCSCDQESGPKAVRQKALQAAQSLLGTPYRSGGKDSQGTDCSGLVQQAYSNYFGQVKMNAAQQFQKLEDEGDENVHASDLEPGDAVYFKSQSGQVNHTAIVEEIVPDENRSVHIIAASSNPIRNSVVRESLRADGTMDAGHSYAGGGRPGRHLE